jgi:site-specific DNA recombinase
LGGGPDDLVQLSVEAKRERHGGEVHLTLAPNASLRNAEVNASLVKAVVRAYTWYQRVLRNEALDQRDLAHQAGLTERYVGRVFACAFLAPDIVEAVLEGRQPRHLTFEKLTRNIPLSWAEQRESFGF